MGRGSLQSFNALFLLIEKLRKFMLGLLSKPFTIYYSSPINQVLKANAISGIVQNCLNKYESKRLCIARISHSF